MYVQRHIPLLKILIPFIGGILLCSKFQTIPLAIGVLLLVCALIVLVCHYYLKKHINPTIQFTISSGILIIIMCLGYLISYQSTSINSPLHFSKQNQGTHAIVTLVSNPSEKPKSIACEIKYNVVWNSENKTECIGKAQLYIQKDSNSKKLKYGDVIAIQKQLDTISGPINPHQFDFKKFYASKVIYHSGFLKSSEWLLTSANKANWLFQFSYTIQDKLKLQFQQYFKNESIRGVAEAIVFGYKDELDQSWLDAFSKTGTIHVLAVSGLHVGIIYVLIAFLLGLSKSKRKWIALKTCLILLVLFMYCLITGFSPSVSRAALMFGLVILANLWQRQSNIYNTLCFACLVLLVNNPANIYNVGFQFSFLAVLGIVFYKEYIRKVLPTSNFIGSKIVMLCAVSIAAQLATFPLGIYYFHQFPNLFIFSNLIVIPCIGIILYVGLLFIITSFILPPLASLLAQLMASYIQFISDVVLFIQDLPFAFFEDVHISFEQLVILYLFIISLTFGLVKRTKAAFILPIMLCMLFLVDDYVLEYGKEKVEVVYFRDGRDMILGFRDNNAILFLAPKASYASSASFDYILRPYLVQERLINNFDILPIEVTRTKANLGIVRTMGNGNLWFNNQSYFIADCIQEYIKGNFKVDNLVIGNNKSFKFYDIVGKKVDAINVVKY